MDHFFYYFSQIRIRLLRLTIHLLAPFSARFRNDFHYTGAKEWMGDLSCYLIDIVAMGEVYQMVFKLIKWKIRKLSEEEKVLLYPIFKDSIDYALIRIDDHAKLGTKNLALAYVSFNTINFRNHITTETFVHEVMHIWQYQNFGSIYLARAIKAQRSIEGYYYGSEQGLYTAMTKSKPLIDFNFEQQADIIEDYYKIKNNIMYASALGNVAYEYYAQQLIIASEQ